jgi:hypothetical protein
LKTAWKLIKFVSGVFKATSICYYANVNTWFGTFYVRETLIPILTVTCIIRSWNSRRNCDVGGWYTDLSHKYKWNGVRSGDLGGQEVSSVRAILKPHTFQTPFSFVSNQSTTRGWYVTINVANGNLISFPVVFKL